MCKGNAGPGYGSRPPAFGSPGHFAGSGFSGLAKHTPTYRGQFGAPQTGGNSVGAPQQNFWGSNWTGPGYGTRPPTGQGHFAGSGFSGLAGQTPTYRGQFGNPTAGTSVPRQNVQTGTGPFGNPLYGGQGYNVNSDMTTGYNYRPINQVAPPPAAQPAANTPTPAPQATPQTSAPLPQVRTQIIGGGADMYRDASPAELNRQGKLKAPYQSGVWANPTQAPLPSAQLGTVPTKAAPLKDSQISPELLAARQKSRAMARALRNG